MTLSSVLTDKLAQARTRMKSREGVANHGEGLQDVGNGHVQSLALCAALLMIDVQILRLRHSGGHHFRKSSATERCVIPHVKNGNERVRKQRIEPFFSKYNEGGDA